jgi:hypothetical protein
LGIYRCRIVVEFLVANVEAKRPYAFGNDPSAQL